MTENIDRQFRDIGNQVTEDTANELLDLWVARTRAWKQEWREKYGEEPALRDFIRHIVSEKNRRFTALSTLGAALWSLTKDVTDGR